MYVLQKTWFECETWKFIIERNDFQQDIKHFKMKFMQKSNNHKNSPSK